MSSPGLPSPPAGGTGLPPIPPGMPPRPPAKVGPVTTPSVNAGNQVAAYAAIKNAAEMLQSAALQIPMGTEEHTKILGIVKDLSKMTLDSTPDPAAQMQNLVQMARQASQRGAPPGLNGVMPAMPLPTPDAGATPPAAAA